MLGEYLKFCHLCIQTAFILPQPLQKRVLHRVWSSISSFNLQYPVFSSGSFSSFLRLFLHLPVTSIIPSIFISIMCLRRQFLRNMWPNHLPFFLFVLSRIILSSLTRCSTSFLTRSVQIIFSILLQHDISELSCYLRSGFRSFQF
jgi:hypothetical protein